jgi:hypothetical protein
MYGAITLAIRYLHTIMQVKYTAYSFRSVNYNGHEYVSLTDVREFIRKCSLAIQEAELKNEEYVQAVGVLDTIERLLRQSTPE